jgi:hypothetical protein
MYLSEKLLPLLFGDAPLKDSRSALFIELALMDLVGFRALDYASHLHLIIEKFLSQDVGKQGLGPLGDYGHDLVGRGCFFECRAPMM